MLYLNRWNNRQRVISAGLCVLTLISVIGSMAMNRKQPAATNYLRTSGNRIVDAAGREVGLSGVNWFGLETANYAPHGLWSRNMGTMLDQVRDLGYNVIRLPFSNAMLEPNVMPTGINEQENPDLVGLSALEVMDQIIAGARARGILIILDNHRSTPGGGPESNGLWYTSNYPEERWINDWKMLAQRYRGNDTVIGMDLRNEPFGACWGCGDASKDWRLAAEKAGNAILSVNPELLIIVEGVAIHDGQNTWWGGNLLGAKEHPINLQVPNRLVYSPHEYPASIYPQTWFSASNYPNNLPEVWDRFWGYLASDYPLLIGEFGTRLETTTDRQWFQTFQSYIKSKQLNWTFWSLNPNSGDTGGLLLHDWVTVDEEKQNILASIQYPLIGSNTRSFAAVPFASQPPTVTSTPAMERAVSVQLLDNFESNGLQHWNTFQAPNSAAIAFVTSPGQTGTYALKFDFNIGAGGWAGTDRSLVPPQNWSAYRGIQFGFYGTNSGLPIRLEILDNSAVGRSGDTAERFQYTFIDNTSGWRTISLPWSQFSRRADWQPEGAPNDGFNLTAVPGFNFSPVNGQGSFQVDNIELISP